MQDLFNQINTNITAAQRHLDDILTEMKLLKTAGMYPAVPTEQWQDRGSKTHYLYHLFISNHNGYEGPGGKRKIYVGCKPDKITAARHLANNRKAWERLNSTAKHLAFWLTQHRNQLENFTKATHRWPAIEELRR